MPELRKFKPLGPWALVQPDPPPEQTSGGIFMPEGNFEERLGYATGIVLELGPGDWKYVKGKGQVFLPWNCKVGERVYFRGHIKNANRIRPDDTNDKRCVLHKDDLLGVIED